MFVSFFDNQGIIHKEFVPPGQAEYKKYYVDFLSRLVQIVLRERPELQERGSQFLLYENASLHDAIDSRIK
jgi:hypothetical protein